MMKRSNSMGKKCADTSIVFQQRVAYHEAGHAAAIQINNQLKNLPPVFFQILLQDLAAASDEDNASNGDVLHRDCIARVKGGRLLNPLPLAINALAHHTDTGTLESAIQHPIDHQLALDADVVNLLIGPLAEARFCHQIDGEPFKQELITVQALKNYGGDLDMALVNDYLKCYSADQQQRDILLEKFFLQAFNFVNEAKHWKSISTLAHYILTSCKNSISCNEVAALLGSRQPL